MRPPLLLDKVRHVSSHLLCSSGAKHELPDRTTVARLLKSGVQSPQLIFNYDAPCTEVWREQVYKEKYGYIAIFPAVNGNLIQIMLSDKGMETENQTESEETK